MKAFIFLWNPEIDSNSFINYKKVLEDSINGSSYVTEWICRSTKPKPGDTAILKRSGKINNGIFARGTVTKSMYLNDDGRKLVTLKIDEFLPHGMEIPLKEVKQIANWDKPWNPASSGETIRDPLFVAIEKLWPLNSKSPSMTLSNKPDDINQTESEVFSTTRIGQGRYREQLLKLWNYRCPLSGISQLEVLLASHIKPWAYCNNVERLDSNNGLILSANFDKLFDTGLITFSDSGNIIISSTIENKDLTRLSLNKDLKLCLNTSQKKYMVWHRDNLFKV